MNEAIKKAMLSVSDARSALLNAKEETPELRAKLDTAEKELRTAIEKDIEQGAKVDPKERSLIEKVELRSYMQAAMTGKKVTGAEAELNQERGLDDQNQVPWDALLPLEERQDVATAVAAGAIGHPQEPVLAASSSAPA